MSMFNLLMSIVPHDKGEKLVELNRRAFEAGRAAVGEAEAAAA